MLPLLGALQEATRLGYYSVTGQPPKEVVDEIVAKEGMKNVSSSCCSQSSNGVAAMSATRAPAAAGEGGVLYRTTQQRGYTSGWLPGLLP